MPSCLSRRWRSLLLISMAVVLGSCSGKPAAPTQPTQPAAPPPAPSVTVTEVRVGVAGNAPATLAPGDKLQLFAQAVSSDGTVSDVTNVALWQSSNPVAATVSPAGLLTAAAEGTLDVTASYASKSGSLRASVEKVGCRVTLSPDSVVYGALAISGFANVTASLSSCRWKVRADAPWLSYQFDPGRSGNGAFSYSLPGNNNTEPRDVNFVVTVEGGPTAIHKVRQERPVSCVYRVSPTSHTINRLTGGKVSFDVTTVPDNCQWRVSGIFSDMSVDRQGGTGAARVTYTINPNAFSFSRTIQINGLTGLNPPGLHTIHMQ